MKIHEIVPSELPELLPLAREFVLGAKLPGGFVDDAFVDILGGLLNTEICAIAVAKIKGQIVGGIGIVWGPAFYNGTLDAEEIFWFVGPAARGTGAGVALLEWAESKADALGARLTMKSLAGNDVSRIYLSRGYVPTESAFTRI